LSSSLVSDRLLANAPVEMQAVAVSILSLALLLSADGLRKSKRTPSEGSYPSEDPTSQRDQLKVRMDSKDAPGSQDGPGQQIVNGTQAPSCYWKSQVGLVSPGSSQVFCGGTLVASNWVVTAQHCVAGQSSIDVWAGSNSPGSGTRRSSYQIIQHSVADMALIQLSQPFSLGGCIDAAPLPTSPIADGSECWITGWGRLYNNGPGAQTLMQASTQVVNKAQCRQQMSGGQQIYDGDVCVFGYYNGQPTTACNGDSGGPLVCSTGSGWTLYGATSWGFSCNGISVYAGTYATRDWIPADFRL